MFLKESDFLAIVNYDGKKYTHKELVKSASFFSENYIKEKDNNFVIIMFENRSEWLFTFYGIWDKKLTPITIDAMSNKEELEYFLKDSGSKTIVVSNKTFEVAKEAIKSLEYEVEIINVDEIEFSFSKKENIILNHPEGEDIAVMLYSSGTTGNPKGVMLTYNNIISQISSIKSLKIDEVGKKEQILAILPYHHILPLMTTNLYFLYHEHQYSIVFIEALSSTHILKALAENEVTMLSLVPRVYQLFYKSVKDGIEKNKVAKYLFKIAKGINNKAFSKRVFKKVHDTFGGNLKTLISGGAKANPEMADFFDVLGFDFCEGYGLTETAPVISCSTPNHGKKNGTVGKVVDNCEVKIVNEELWVKGPIVMKGYFNKPEKTKEVLTEDGWFNTGDVASIDDEGFITILGRKNAMIVLSNGKNIDPEKLEIKLMDKSKGIFKEAAILSNDDKLVALIVPDREEMKIKNISNIHAHIKDVIQFYNAEVHNHEKILEYRLKDEELPKTRIGKLRRFMLKEIYLDDVKEEETHEEKPNSKEYLEIEKFITNLKGKTPKSTVDLEIEFGLDSLDQVELLSFLERSFGVLISTEEFKENSSLLKLSEYVKERTNGFVESENQWANLVRDINVEEPKKDKKAYLLFRPFIYLFLKIYFRLGLKNKNKIQDKQQIFIANHESFIDPVAINMIIPAKIAQKTYSVAIDWYFKNTVMKFIADNSNVLLLDIDNNIKDTIEKIVEIIKQGKNIFIFPEGTRTKDGNLSEFKKVFAIISKELNIPITCLKIDGAFEAYSRYDKLPKPKKVTVEYIGEILPENLTYDEIVEKAVSMYK